MKRFQQLLVAAAPDRKPWEAVPTDVVLSVAAQCTAGDIREIIAALDELAEEKSRLPSWDGDAQDDVAKAQALFASILAALPASASPVFHRELSSARIETRKWIQLAMAGNKTGRATAAD